MDGTLGGFGFEFAYILGVLSIIRLQQGHFLRIHIKIVAIFVLCTYASGNDYYWPAPSDLMRSGPDFSIRARLVSMLSYNALSAQMVSSNLREELSKLSIHLQVCLVFRLYASAIDCHVNCFIRPQSLKNYGASGAFTPIIVRMTVLSTNQLLIQFGCLT